MDTENTFTISDWISKYQSWATAPPELKKPVAKYFLIPQELEFNLLPSPHLSIAKMLDFPPPLQNSAMTGSQPAQFFSKELPDICDRDLRIRLPCLSIPDAKTIHQLLAGSRQRFIDGCRSYSTLTSYEITCGAPAERRRRYIEAEIPSPYPGPSRPRHIPSILPIPLDEARPRHVAQGSSTGCGTLLGLRAQSGGQMWLLRGAAERVVVPLSPEYFTEDQKRQLGGVPRMNECGCTAVGVGCCVCGNALGVYNTYCATHFKPKSSTSYQFLAASVSPLLPLRARNRRITRAPTATVSIAPPAPSSIAYPTATATTSTSGTAVLSTTDHRRSILFSFTTGLTDPTASTTSPGGTATARRSTVFDRPSWMLEPPPSPTASERACRDEQAAAELQAMADEVAYENELEEARRAADTARFEAVHGRTQGVRVAVTIEQMSAALGNNGPSHPPRDHGGFNR
ncbi:hypothetical protein K438DRAFT_1776002 [Mycena galopus ATCC 62051]|nr:hypothetical protein K438DRAFT_1776002 [Mycena galopus ATCC 62051]